MLVKALGFAIFLLAFVPLVFGGTVYRMLEKIMTAKLVLVLGYLSLIAVTLVSWPVIRDVCTGFFRVGTVPLRAETIILERDFTVQRRTRRAPCIAPGEPGKKTASRPATSRSRPASKVARFDLRNNDKLTPELIEIRDRLLERSPRARRLPGDSSSRPRPATATLLAEGEIINHHLWKPIAAFACAIRAARAITRTFPRFPSRSRNAFATCSHTKESNMSVC